MNLLLHNRHVFSVVIFIVVSVISIAIPTSSKSRHSKVNIVSPCRQHHKLIDEDALYMEARRGRMRDKSCYTYLETKENCILCITIADEKWKNCQGALFIYDSAFKKSPSVRRGKCLRRVGPKSWCSTGNKTTILLELSPHVPEVTFEISLSARANCGVKKEDVYADTPPVNKEVVFDIKVETFIIVMCCAVIGTLILSSICWVVIVIVVIHEKRTERAQEMSTEHPRLSSSYSSQGQLQIHQPQSVVQVQSLQRFEGQSS